MEKRLLLFLFAMLTTVSTWAYDFEVDGIYYNRRTETTVAVSRSGSGSYSGDVVIPSSVTYEGTTYSVTVIVYAAFRNCSGLTSVEIPSSVTEIGLWAFSGCSGLTSVEIPSSVTEIRKSAFSGCSGITSITIPPSVTSIGDGAFEGCDKLTYNTYFNAKYLGNDDNPYLVLIEATSKEITECEVSKDTRFISSNAFQNCSNLTSVEIPSSVISIGGWAFDGCNITRIDYTGTLEEWYNKQWNPGNISYSYDLYINGKKVEELEIPSSVTSIGDYAFSGCSGLTSVEIPSSMISIGDWAFSGCNITRIDYTGTLEEWYNKQWNPRNISYSYDLYINGKKVEELEIPSRVTSIGDYAFSGCSSLTSVEIPSSVTQIGNYAFSGCSGLTSVEIPSSVTSIGSYAFSGYNLKYNEYDNGLYLGNSENPYLYLVEAKSNEITSFKINDKTSFINSGVFYNCSGLTTVEIPSSVTSIGEYAFFNCDGLISVEIPSSVKEIGYGVFSYCNGLTSVEIHSGVTSIGEEAFWGCSGLISVEIPLSVTEIGRGAFSYCSGLTSVVIPSSVTEIGDRAFSGCSSLTSVEIPSSVTSIGDRAFSECSGLSSVVIPSSVTEIGYGAFRGCSGLRSVVIPSSVTEIGSSAFGDCSGLRSVVIPSSVTEIGSSAFGDCSGLSSVVIPSSVTEIGDYVFSRCQNLRSVRIEAENPPSMSVKSAFADSPINAIYIPDGTTEAYKTALGTWEDGTYPNYIEFGKLPELENTSGGNAIVVAVDGNEVTLDIKLDEGFTLGQIIVNGVVVYPTINKALMPVTVTDLGGGKYLVSGVTNADYIKVVYSDVNDTPTAIENITILRPVREGIYNLQGQKLAEPQRGINIIEGKKVIVR